MKFRRLGRTGLKVSELCLGTMTFGHGTDEPTAQRIVDMSLDRGVNFFDTADSYGGGESERMLGRALGKNRRRAVVATKFFNPMDGGVNDSGMSRVHIMNAIDDSLRRIGTDWVDVYYIHHVDVETPIEEMLRALDDLVRQGKVRYIACSNYEAWRLATALGISERERLSRFACYQPQYSLVVRDIEQEIIPLCLHEEIGVVVWGPLAGGFLSGKYRPGERVVSGSRSEERWVFPADYFASNADEVLGALLEEAQKIGREPAELAIRWTVDRPGITSAIVGARTAEQLEMNLRASELELPEETAAALERISRPRLLYPRSLEQGMVERRAAAVNAVSEPPRTR